MVPEERSGMRAHADGVEGAGAIDEGTLPTRPTPRKTPDRSTVISVAVIDEHPFTRDSTARSLRGMAKRLAITSFATLNQFESSAEYFELIVFRIHQDIGYRDGNRDQFAPVKNLSKISPVIILSDVDSSESVRAAFESGARAYMSTANTTLELAIEIMYLVKVGGTFVPVSCLSAESTEPGKTPGPVTTSQFTSRQIAVLERLKLGRTNKAIAFELEISESSVKTHIQNIMKKTNARNRTEVVSRTQVLVVNETRAVDHESSPTRNHHPGDPPRVRPKGDQGMSPRRDIPAAG